MIDRRFPRVSGVRVLIVAESFLPQVNGVTNSVLRVLEHLRTTGHEALVLAPADQDVPSQYAGFEVRTVDAFSLPKYADVKIGLSRPAAIDDLLQQWAPDVVHLAAPFTMGYAVVLGCSRLSIPTVAVYQTQVAEYAERYGWKPLRPFLWYRVRRIHELATINLAPSSFAADQLRDQGIPRVQLWKRGVDGVRFNPAKRDAGLRAELAPGGEVLVGYMGRLAPEKQVTDLTTLSGLPHTRVVVIGGGPERAALEQALPGAAFLGKLGGNKLPRAVASLDVFVHPGELETFCQSIQEAQACGVPVVAPARGGPIDLVASGRTGFLYPPGDLGEMRSAVARLAADPVLRTTLGRQARASVEHRTWDYIGNQLLGYYAEAIRSTASGRLEIV